MDLLASFILQNFKKILRADPELWGYAIFRPRMAHLSLTIFFGTNHYYYFHLCIGPFKCAKFLKNLTAYPELWGCIIFGPKIINLPQFFFWKIINITLIYKLAPFIVKTFLKILPADPELWGCAIFGTKIPQFVLNKTFLHKSLLLLPSTYCPFHWAKF